MGALDLEGHSRFGPYFQPWFEIHAAGKVRLAVTTITVCEVLTGPFRSNDEATARRYRSVIDSWQLVDLDADIAESAARLRT